MSDSRDHILSALRRARPAGAAAAAEPPAIGTAPSLVEARVFRDYPESAQLLACFEQKFQALSGELIKAQSPGDAARALFELLSALSTGGKPPRVAAQRFALLERLLAASPDLNALLASSDELPEDPVTLSHYDAGITACDRLLARTGGLFVRATTSGGRQLSVLPPVHVVVAEQKQLVPSVGDALDELAKDPKCSFGTMIHGPSRTADIEKILVLGAHGPKRLCVILLP